jgi:group I intron endonuclease
MIYTILDQKNFPTTTGVYSIYFKNCKSNKIYIGSASRSENKKSENGFYDRWSTHICRLKNKTSGNPILQNAYNKYGQDNMIFNILEECPPSDCLIKEQYYIDKFNSYIFGYNARPLSNNNKGFKQTEYQKKQVRNKYKEIRNSYVNDIKFLYNSGKTTREISQTLKISRGVISKIFDENNITPRKLMDYTKKKIYQFDLNGIFIKEWESVNSCSRELNFNIHGIHRVLQNKCSHFKNFYFSFEKLKSDTVLKNIQFFTIKSKNRKYLNITQFDKNNNKIKTWRDVKEIVEFYNFSNSKGICQALRTENNYYKNFHWKLE